jgi:hypothetical protein
MGQRANEEELFREVLTGNAIQTKVSGMGGKWLSIILLGFLNHAKLDWNRIEINGRRKRI